MTQAFDSQVFFLSCGRLRAPGGVVGPGRGLAGQTLSLTVAVLVRGEELLLVDAGFSAEICRDPSRQLGRLRALSLGLQLHPEDALVLQLRRLGFDPARVTTIVATHLHLDHLSGVADFPRAELITTSAEQEACSARVPKVGYRPADLAAVRRLRLVRLDQGPRLGFPASLDLFGDGQVVLLEAGGHTRGHLAVALQAGDRCFVHVGDAVYQSWEYQEEHRGRPSRLAALLADHRGRLEQTHACLRGCVADPARPILVPSHDAEVFATLPQALRAAPSLPDTRPADLLQAAR